MAANSRIVNKLNMRHPRIESLTRILSSHRRARNSSQKRRIQPMRAQQNNKDLKPLAILGSLVMFLGTLNAQNDAVRAIYLSAAYVPTNISTVQTYPDPPKDF